MTTPQRQITRFFYLLNRYWILFHLLLIPIMILVGYRFAQCSSFLGLNMAGQNDALFEFLVCLQLMISRLFSISGWESNLPTLACLFLCIFVIPQILFWLFRRKQWMILSLLSLAIVLDTAALYTHALYCRWSYNEVCKRNTQTLTQDELFARCGRPLYYKNHWEGVLSSYYADGSNAIRVNLKENGEAFVDGPPFLWMD